MEEEYLGMVKLFAGTYTPRDFLDCDGRSLSITEFPAMFAILGTAFGGDGRTTFTLPKLDPVGGCRYIICVQGIFPPRP